MSGSDRVVRPRTGHGQEAMTFRTVRCRDPAGVMKPLSRVWNRVPAVLQANIAARLAALAALTLATILVARAGGPKLLGELTLLRVLPGLAGVLASCGLPTAAPYFLAGRDPAAAPRLRTTLIALTFAGALAACGCWLALSPLLHRVFFHPWQFGVVLAATVPVFTQLWVAVGKSLLQGENDMRGANFAIAAEETAFLPVYLVLIPFLHGTALLMSALVGADVVVIAGIGLRLLRHGFLKSRGRPDLRLAMAICRYGLRGQVGGTLTLINLRLDVVILGALVGPAVLGIYAVASKYAELLRLPGLAITYVLYPRLATRDQREASRYVAVLDATNVCRDGIGRPAARCSGTAAAARLRRWLRPSRDPRLHTPVRARRRGGGRSCQRLLVRYRPARHEFPRHRDLCCRDGGTRLDTHPPLRRDRGCGRFGRRVPHQQRRVARVPLRGARETASATSTGVGDDGGPAQVGNRPCRGSCRRPNFLGPLFATPAYDVDQIPLAEGGGIDDALVT